MEQNSAPTPAVDTDISTVVRNLPKPIRDFLEAGRCALFAEAFMARYDLHVDQVGLLERELTSLLMGLESPEEFVAALSTEGRLSPEAVEGIIGDVNNEIIKPLQEALRALPKEEPEPIVKPEPVVPVLAQKPPVAPMPTKPQMPQVGAPKPMVPNPMPMKAAPPPNLPGTPLADALKRAGAIPPAPTPKPASLLEDHEEPHINVGGVAPLPPKPPITPPPIPTRPAMGPAGKPLWNAPRPMTPPITPPAPMPPVPPAPAPQAPQMPQAPKPPITPPPVKYASDPYREAIDDK
jgi:hypothetical protein